MSKIARQARDRLARTYVRGEVPADAEVGGADNELAGSRSRLLWASNGHLKLYGNPFFSVQRLSADSGRALRKRNAGTMQE